MALDSIVVLAVSLIQKFTGSVAEEHFGEENAGNQERNQGRDTDGVLSEVTIPLLNPVHVDDLSRTDPSDTIFEEYTNTGHLANPLAWKQDRPSCGKSLLQCSYFGLAITLLGGIPIGFPAIALLYLVMNTAEFCEWKDLNDADFPKLYKHIRIASYLLQRLFINFAPLLLLMIIFKWHVFKELHLVTITLLAAFIDISYHLLLGVFELYKPSLQLYPSNGIFCLLILIISYAIGKKRFPRYKVKALKVAFKLCAQFLVGLPITYLYVYKIFPWFAKQQGLRKAVVAGISPLSTLPVKVISRLCAIHSEEFNHAGTAFVLTAVAYGAPSIAFRFMQAEMDNYVLFVALSVGDGIAHVLERSTVILRDYIWEKFARKCLKGQIDRPYRTSRSHRLLADMTIQGMLFESVALVIAIAMKHLYQIVYEDMAKHEVVQACIDFSKRLFAGLGIILLSNIVVILVLTRFINVAIPTVWKHRWKTHCLVSTIVTFLIVFYFTHFSLVLVRADYERNPEIKTRFLNFTNCSKPFMVFH